MTEVQERELHVLKEIVKVLKAHHLRYFAVGGTCIGAIRHKGFIPWDDDIDIAMPRKDFELFRRKYYKELPEYLKKIDGEVSKSHNFLFMKIHDSRTTYVEFYAENSPDRYSGAFVDIMPVDGLPSEEKEIQKFMKQIGRWQSMNSLCRPGMNIPKNKKEQFKIGVKRLVKPFLHLLYSYDYFYQKVISEAEKHDYDHSDKFLFTWRNMHGKYDRLVYRAELFRDLTEVPFEDSTISVPKHYDQYLTKDFGDYMQPPPPEQQHSVHHVYLEDMKKPCSYYAKLKQKEIDKK